MSKVQAMTRVALSAAALCIVAQFSVPIGAVPVTLQTLMVVLVGVLLGPKLGALLVYLLLGCVGLPVFSGGTGGIGRLAGATGGYLIGFIPMAWLSGLCAERGYVHQTLCALAGYALLDALGTLQLMWVAQMNLAAALAAAVWPFLLKDLICVLGGVALGRAVKKRIK